MKNPLAIQLYRIGDKAVSGHEIQTILGQSVEFAVYQTVNGEMRWEYRRGDGTLPSEYTSAVREFDRLLSDIKSRMPERHKRSAYDQLGKSLFAAINTGEPAEYEACFRGVEEVIDRRCVEKARFIYVSAALITGAITSALMIGVAALYWNWQDDFFIGVFGGVLGGVLSVVQRNQHIDVDPRADDRHTVLQGSLRTFLGATFGVLMVLAIHAEFVTVFCTANVSAIGLIAVAAGFSERIVPESIGSFERSVLGRVET